MRLRVLLISARLPAVGGVATWTSEVIREVEKRPEIDLTHVGLIAEPAKQGGTFHLPRPLVRGWHWLIDLSRILAKLITVRPHVVHITTAGRIGALRDIAVLLMSRPLRAKGVLDYRIWFHAARHNKFHLKLSRIAIRLAAGVRVLDLDSRALASSFGGPDKVRQIPNMVDAERFEGLLTKTGAAPAVADEGLVRLVFVGRVELSKGVVALVEACVPLDGVALRLAGPVMSELDEVLDHLARQRQGPWLEQLGRISRTAVAREIHRSDILVLPSHSEGFPNAILEAMSLGKPVVVSNVGGMPEMIAAGSDEPCGLMVAAGEVEPLRDAIRTLAEDPELRRRMGERGRKRVAEEYSPERILSLLEQMWRGVAGLPE